MGVLIHGRTGLARSRRVLFYGALGLFSAYLAFFLVFGRMGLVAHLRLRVEADRIDREVGLAHQEIAVLSDRAEALSHDSRTIERLARERLGMVRPGDTVFLFEDRDPHAIPRAPEADFQP